LAEQQTGAQQSTAQYTPEQWVAYVASRFLPAVNRIISDAEGQAKEHALALYRKVKTSGGSAIDTDLQAKLDAMISRVDHWRDVAARIQADPLSPGAAPASQVKLDDSLAGATLTNAPAGAVSR
jgi:hypothetical protein